AGGALLLTRAKQSWPLMGGADGMDEGGGCGQRVEAVTSAWAATSAVGVGEVVAACWLVGVLADGRGRGDDGRRCDARPAAGLADDGRRRGNEDRGFWKIRRLDEALEENVLFEMGHDRSGMKLKLLMTGEEDLPRVATVMNNVLVVAVVMNGLDRGNDGPLMVGSAVGFRRWQARSTVTRGDRRWVRRRGRADGSFDGDDRRWQRRARRRWQRLRPPPWLPAPCV
ncbi:hypothetical protein ACLOJK_006541, partial [Asimina triloba]